MTVHCPGGGSIFIVRYRQCNFAASTCLHYGNIAEARVAIYETPFFSKRTYAVVGSPKIIAGGIQYLRCRTCGGNYSAARPCACKTVWQRGVHLKFFNAHIEGTVERLGIQNSKINGQVDIGSMKGYGIVAGFETRQCVGVVFGIV